MPGILYVLANAHKANRLPTLGLSAGWICLASPTSEVTTIPLLGIIVIASNCAWRSSAAPIGDACLSEYW